MRERDLLEARIRKLADEDVCLAFSGGVDSSLLLKMAAQAAERTGNRVYAVTFDSRLHPSCDLEIAKRVAAELGGIHEVITVDELEQEEIRINPVNRCYLLQRSGVSDRFWMEPMRMTCMCTVLAFRL